MGCSFSGLNALYDAVNGGGDVWINQNRFRIVKQLGEGGFAFVYLVKEVVRDGASGCGGLSAKKLKNPTHISDDGTYALKKVLVQSEEQLALVKEEIHVSSLFGHANLLPLLDHAIIAVKGPQEGRWNHEAYLLFPVHMDGTLLDNVKAMQSRKEFFSALTVLQIFRQVGEIQGAYQIKVTTTALALLLSSRHEELIKVNVNGHLIKSNAGITTRSKAKSAPEQWTIIPLRAKIFSLLSDALVESQEQNLDDDSGSDEDSDWEEVLDNNGCGLQDLLYQSNVPSKRNAAVDHLDAMAKVFNESDGDNSEEELVKDDPLNETKLAGFLTQFFLNLRDMDSSLFDHLCQNLTHAQRIAVEKVVRK